MVVFITAFGDFMVYSLSDMVFFGDGWQVGGWLVAFVYYYRPEAHVRLGEDGDRGRHKRVWEFWVLPQEQTG